MLQSQVPETPAHIATTFPPVATTAPPVATPPVAATDVSAVPDIDLSGTLASAIAFCSQTAMLAVWAGILQALFRTTDVFFSNEAARVVANYNARIPLGTYYNFVFDRVFLEVSHRFMHIN